MSESDRIAELEARLAFQEDTISTLNDSVARQSHQLDALQQQFRVLYKKMGDLAFQWEEGQGDAGDEVPPHY